MPIPGKVKCVDFTTDEIRRVHTIISGNVRRLRKEKGISQESLAELVGVSKPYIYRCENMVYQYIGTKYTHFSTSLLYKISKLLGCKMEDFFVGL
jgi:transcriptional regulator with XRE-family HTH domain